MIGIKVVHSSVWLKNVVFIYDMIDRCLLQFDKVFLLLSLQ